MPGFRAFTYNLAQTTIAQDDSNAITEASAISGARADVAAVQEVTSARLAMIASSLANDFGWAHPLAITYFHVAHPEDLGLPTGVGLISRLPMTNRTVRAIDYVNSKSGLVPIRASRRRFLPRRRPQRLTTSSEPRPRLACPVA